MAVRPQTINERPRGQLRVCRCWWEKRFNSMYLKTLDFSEAIASDHDCMKQVRSCDTARPGRDEADVEAAVAGTRRSYVQDTIYQLYWKAMECMWWILGCS